MQDTLAENKEVGSPIKKTAGDFFDTEYLETDLKGRSVRGGVVTVAAQGMMFFLRMGSTVILARLLTPQDFGLIAMVTVITGFVELFKDMGLSMATVQRAEIDHTQVSALFWINVALSFFLVLIVTALSPVIALFYGEPRLIWITLVLASAFIFSGLTVQHQALLRRQMRFGVLASVEIISMLVGVLVAIILAWYGAKYWAIVLMYLTSAISGAICVWVACAWRPSLPVFRSNIRSILAFGGNLTAANFTDYFSRNLDKMLLGKFLGAGQLGLYSKAYGLLLLPLQQITRPIMAVAIPSLSRLQNEPERYRKYYLKTISLIAFVTMPGVMFLIIMSDEVIYLVLGPQWIGASKIFAVLGISALPQPVLCTVGWLFISTGRTDRLLRWGIFSSICIITSYLIGLPYGAIGVAAGYTICILLLAVPAWWYATKATPISLRNIFSVIWHPVLATFMAGFALVEFKLFFPIASTGLGGILIGFVGMIVIYLGVSCTLARGLTPISGIIGLLRQFRR